MQKVLNRFGSFFAGIPRGRTHRLPSGKRQKVLRIQFLQLIGQTEERFAFVDQLIGDADGGLWPVFGPSPETVVLDQRIRKRLGKDPPIVLVLVRISAGFSMTPGRTLCLLWKNSAQFP